MTEGNRYGGLQLKVVKTQCQGSKIINYSNQ